MNDFQIGQWNSYKTWACLYYDASYLIRQTFAKRTRVSTRSAAPFLSMKKTGAWATSESVGDYVHQRQMAQDGPCWDSVGDVTNTAKHTKETQSKGQMRIPARDPSPRPFKSPELMPGINTLRACADTATR